MCPSSGNSRVLSIIFTPAAQTCVYYVYIIYYVIYLSFCFSFALGPEYQEKLRLGEELRAIEETLKFKKRQIKELQQDLQVSPRYGLTSGAIASEY